MIADKELERKVLNDTVDSQTGNTVNKYMHCNSKDITVMVAAPDVCCD